MRDQRIADSEKTDNTSLHYHNSMAAIIPHRNVSDVGVPIVYLSIIYLFLLYILTKIY